MKKIKKISSKKRILVSNLIRKDLGITCGYIYNKYYQKELVLYFIQNFGLQYTSTKSYNTFFKVVDQKKFYLFMLQFSHRVLNWNY